MPVVSTNRKERGAQVRSLALYSLLGPAYFHGDTTTRREEALMKDYRVKPGRALSLVRFDPDDSGEYKKTDQGKEKAKAITAGLIGRLGELQERLYANGTRSLLIVLQGTHYSP